MKRLSIAGIFLWLGLSASAGDISPAFQTANEVYNNIIRSIGRGAPAAPIFTPTELPVIAELHPDGTILIGKKFVTICKSLGEDSMNAMALVLGHELAHHYLEHYWTKEYGSAYASLAWGKKMEEVDLKNMGVLESQADEFGMFYAFTAGYNPFNISETLYRKLYQEFNLREDMPGYPPLEDRVQIAHLAAQRLERLVPVFDVGKYTTIIAMGERGNYRQYLLQKAGECFDHILSERFNSAEIYNNAGLVRLLTAIGATRDSLFPWQLPVVFDEESKLQELIERDPTTKGADVNVSEHLEMAERYFKDALDVKKEYFPAYVNLSSVYLLADELEDAEYYISKAGKYADGSDFNQSIIDVLNGILEALQDRRKPAQQFFSEAANRGYMLATVNLDILVGNKEKKTEPSFDGFLLSEETIHGESLIDLYYEADISVEYLYKLGGDSRFYVFPEDQGDLYTIECRKANCPYNDLVLFVTRNNYEYPTAKGIMLGDQMSKIEEAYGKAGYVVQTGSQTYYLYTKLNMFFIADGNNVLKRWAHWHYAG